ERPGAPREPEVENDLDRDRPALARLHDRSEGQSEPKVQRVADVARLEGRAAVRLPLRRFDLPGHLVLLSGRRPRRRPRSSRERYRGGVTGPSTACVTGAARRVVPAAARVTPDRPERAGERRAAAPRRRASLPAAAHRPSFPSSRSPEPPRPAVPSHARAGTRRRRARATRAEAPAGAV